MSQDVSGVSSVSFTPLVDRTPYLWKDLSRQNLRRACMIRKRNNTVDVDEKVSPVLVLGATFGVLGISSVFLASLASFFPVPARSQTNSEVSSVPKSNQLCRSILLGPRCSNIETCFEKLYSLSPGQRLSSLKAFVQLRVQGKSFCHFFLRTA